MVLAERGLLLAGPVEDCGLAHWLLQAATAATKGGSMSDPSLPALRISVPSPFLGPAAAAGGTGGRPEGGVCPREASYRAVAALRQCAALTPALAHLGLLPLYRRIECPLLLVAAGCEYAGLGVDVAFLRSMCDQLELRMEAIENTMHLALPRY